MTKPQAPTTTRRRVAAALLILAVGLLPACSSGESHRSVIEVVKDAISQAKQKRAGTTGNESPAPTPAPSATIGTGGRASFDYAQYQETLSQTIALLEKYWDAELPDLGGTARPLAGYTYYRSDEGGGPTCGNEAAPANNAFYCPDGDFIAWDETGLMIPYYVQGGDFAASFVLAHEYGHAVQVRLPRQEETGLLRELQADCFAGAWSRWVSKQNMLDAGDLDEATLAVFAARDVPGTPWTDPRAHGSGFQRTRAFGDGFEAGADICYPAPANRWVLTSTG